MRTRRDRVAVEVKRNWGVVPGRSGQALRNHGHHIILPDLHRQQLCSEQTPATHAHTAQSVFVRETCAADLDGCADGLFECLPLPAHHCSAQNLPQPQVSVARPHNQGPTAHSFRD